ncbi:MAG TPA: hypothetical protein VIH99_07140 [Bdellovibrionota bacterium]|jgi:hypothetical protein
MGLAVIVLSFTYGYWLLPVLTDWVSSAVDEGYTSYAAQRIRAGELPYRDFFFLWTPGIAYLHALLQALGCSWVGERAAALLASCGSGFLVWRWARSFTGKDRALLTLLLLAWGYSLWNIPYSSWYAVFFGLLAVSLFPQQIVLAALAWAMAFWFKQNVGILSLLGALVWLLWRKKNREAARLGGVFLLALLLPFLGFAFFGGATALSQALRQIFLFPFLYPSLMGAMPEAQTLAAPLTAFGLWLLSLFFLGAQGDSRSLRLLQLGVLTYVFVYAFRAPREFLLGGLLWVSLLVWPASAALGWAGRTEEERAQFLALWLPGLGIFLQSFPRVDFQHLLFVFPLAAYFLLTSLARLNERYPWLPFFWSRLPAFLLLAGGVWLQLEVVQTRLGAAPDSLERISQGPGRRLDEEVTAVWRFLSAQGLKRGDPILVLPNATSVYTWTSFRNPTPHQQFFPGYVEAFGHAQAAVLPAYRSAGGRYLVVQERSGLEQSVPEIYRQIQTDYEVVKSFPEHFTIYAPRK